MTSQRPSRPIPGVAWLIILAISLFIATAAADNHSTEPQAQATKTDVQAAPQPALPPDAQVLEQQPFDAEPDEWTAVQTGLPHEQPTWATTDGVLAQTTTASAGASFTPAMYLAPAAAAGDSLISTQIFPQGNQIAGLVFRASEAGFYLFAVYHTDEAAPVTAKLMRYDADTGFYTTLAETGAGQGFQRDRWQELRVDLRGTTITASFSGRQIFTVDDGTFTEGQAGIYTMAVGQMLFDNFIIAQR